ncbi:MAG: ABC transporter permease [Pseudobutyrivibrio ruminis]|nr:ABC transporter permease [Pseudobutyrivibrio ruminis]
MLLRKVLRDLRRNAVQFVSIFIMTFFAMLISAAFDAENYEYGLMGTKYLEETNFKDMDIQGDEFSFAQISALEQMDEIQSVNGIIRATGKITLDKERPLVLSYIDGNDVSKMKLIVGEPYTKGAKGAWIEERFATPMGIKVGDVINITTEGTSFKEEIKGIVYYPEYLYYIPNDTYSEPEYGTHGFVVMDISEAPYAEIKYNQLVVDLKEVKGQSLSLTEEEKNYMLLMKQKIIDKLDNKKVIVKTKTEDDMYDGFAGSVDSTDALSNTFTFLFLLTAVLGIITTMTRITSNQRSQIGTMKALGFSDKKITIHYLSYSVIVTALAAIIGTFAGEYTLGLYLIDLDIYYYQNPYTSPALTSKSIIMPLLAVIISGATTFICTRKTLLERAADILRPEPPKNNSGGVLEKTKIWEHLGFSTRWNVRDIANNKLRAIMSILGIAVTSMLLFSAVGFYELLAGQSTWMYDELLNTNYKILFTEETDYGVVSDYAKEYKGQMVESVTVTVHSDNGERVRPFIVVDEGNIYRFQDMNLEYFDLPDNGIIVTSRLKDSLGLELGDELSWYMPGDTYEYSAQVVGFCRQALDQGFIMSRTAWRNIGGDFRPNIVYTNITVPTTLRDKDGIIAVNDKDMLVRSAEADQETGYSISIILIVIATVMGAVVLYNLGVLSYIEKVREIATMKVLGFQSFNIRLILLQQNLSITAIGAIIGVPTGNLVIKGLDAAYFEDTSDVISDLSPIPYLAAVAGTFIVSMLINAFVTSKINEINMVEALKGVE